MMTDVIEVNDYNTKVTSELIGGLKKEVADTLLEYLSSVPYLKTFISKNRKRACDLPRDEKGKIIINIEEPHILEDMDYFRPSALHFEKTGRYTDYRPSKNPNSPFYKWISEERRRCYEGYVRESDGEWITGDYYFFLNYCPMLMDEEDKNLGIFVRQKRFPDVMDGQYYLFHYMWKARTNNLMSCCLASRQKGKAHPYSQKVYTPEGEKRWGDIKIGDKLFGYEGGLTTVVDIPFDDYDDIYTVTLSDGRKFQCTAGHLFYVKDNRKHPSMRVITLKDIMEDDYAHKRKDGKIEYYFSIPNNNLVEFNKKDVDVDPYTLGLILGDGSLCKGGINTVEFTSDYKDIETYKKNVPYEIVEHNSKYSFGIKINGFKRIFEKYGLYKKQSEYKFIPNEYLFNSSDVRMEVLKGLMDTDGTVNSSGTPMFYTVSKQLADNIIWLCHSLGYNSTCFIKQGKYKDKNGEHICNKVYNITIYTSDKIFKLDRKNDKIIDYKTKPNRSKSISKANWTKIVNIEYSHNEKAKCVIVDNDSHCYLIDDFIVTHNTATSAAMLARRLILGESDSARNNVSSTVIASSEDYLTGDDVIFDKFQIYLDHVAETTQWPSKRLKTTEGGLVWQMGYKLNDGKNTRKGSLNKVTGTSINTKKSKKRGGRVSLFIIEEMGSFANLKSLYTTLLPSVRSAKGSYGLIHMIGTSGDSDSDFEGARELFCNPIGHFILNNVNVWDMPLQGTKYIAFFYPAYINLGGYTDKNGNSDVVGALIHLLKERYTVKYNTGDPDALLRHCAENPIFPEESMLRTTRNVFPTLELNERIKQLENDDTAFDEVEVGELFMNGNGDVEFKHTKELPIRFFPHSDNKIRGAVEIFERPIKDKETGEITPGRYIIGNDPVDKDSAETVSLSSTFVFDLYKDCIVAEYTGRRDYAEEGYEITRMLCRYYNAQCYFENNLLGFFNYMKEKGDLKYVAKTPSTIKAQELSANDGVRNTTYGIRSTTFTINRFLQQIRDWLLQEVPAQDENGNAIMTKNLYLIKNLALLKELALYNDKGNFDRISALGMLMLGREEKITITGGNFNSSEKHTDYKDDKFISQCLNGGRKKVRNSLSVERYSREEVKRILNIDSNLKLYHFK